MQITNENVGDTLCLYEKAKYIRILDVNPQYVYYATEDGSHYATSERFADALLVTDPDRLAVFEENYMLGKALNAAEYKAFVHMFSDSEPERGEADNVLSVVRAQQEHLSSRLSSDRKKNVPGEALTAQFLSQFSERSSGSHVTFWGHKVQLLSSWTYEFLIDGKTMSYETAKDYLSKVQLCTEPTRKPSLSDTINAANIRRETSASPDIVRDASVPER